MIKILKFVTCISLLAYSSFLSAQTNSTSYELSKEGKTDSDNKVLETLLSNNSSDQKAQALYASATSWYDNYSKVRATLNAVLTADKKNRDAWVSAVKNELHAKNYSTALGLANKALHNLKNDKELKRLKNKALNSLDTMAHSPEAWYNVESKIYSF